MLVLVCALMAWPATAPADWSPRPNHPLNSDGTTARAITAATVAGVPYVGWAESTDSVGLGPVYVARPDDGTFASVGGAVTTTGGQPLLADIGGTPYVALLESYHALKVFSLQGGAWTQVGPAIATDSSTNLGGLIDLGGHPAVAYTTSAGAVEVDTLAGAAWTKLGGTITAHTADSSVLGFAYFSQGPSLVANGGAPIVAVTETRPAASGFGAQLLVYGHRFNGTAWTGLNGDQPLEPAADSGFLGGLTMVGSTPYIAFDDVAPDFSTTTSVFSIAGTALTRLGDPVYTEGGGTATGLALGAYRDAPMTVLRTFASGSDSLVARTLAGSAWTQFGSALGVPPLPGEGNPYPGSAIAVDTAADIPYVIFEQQAPGHNGTFHDAYVEGYTPGAVSPTAPAASTMDPPVTTVTEDPAATPTATPAEPPGGATLGLVRAPSLKGRRLRSGIRATCPAGGAACPGTLAVKARKVKKTVAFSIRAGKHRTIALRLPKAVAKRLRKRRATVTVTVTGANGAPTALSQRLRA